MHRRYVLQAYYVPRTLLMLVLKSICYCDFIQVKPRDQEIITIVKIACDL